MKNIEIYTTPTCPYCLAAKRLLSAKGVAYCEIDVSADPARRKEMSKRAEGRRTVPQIFIDNVPIGGCDELYRLESKGKLDKVLARDALEREKIEQ